MITEQRVRLRTQISSRYSTDNPGVFYYKDRIPAPVAFPAGSEILVYTHGFAITTPEEGITPFDRTQIHFFRNVRENPIHVVYNVSGEDSGYLGESASVETAYALVHNKHIFIKDPDNLHFGEKVDLQIADIVARNVPEMHSFSPFDWGIDAYGDGDGEETNKYLWMMADGVFGEPQYDITPQDTEIVMRNVLDLTRKYRQTWNEFKAQ